MTANEENVTKENCQSLFCGKDFFVALVALILPHSVRFCPYYTNPYQF